MSSLSGIFGGPIAPVVYVEDLAGNVYNQVPGSELVLISEGRVVQQEELTIVNIGDLPQLVQDGLGFTLIDLERM